LGIMLVLREVATSGMRHGQRKQRAADASDSKKN
jgi:hypothetical protein